MDKIGTTTTIGDLSDLTVERFFQNNKHLNLLTDKRDVETNNFQQNETDKKKGYFTENKNVLNKMN